MKEKQIERGKFFILIIQVRYSKGLNELLVEKKDKGVIGRIFGDRINRVYLMEREEERFKIILNFLILVDWRM